jgi:NAD-dependent protein deacetylase/lipoamidase
MEDSSAIEQVAHWLASSQRAVVLTGAGISTESGIPDFRSPGGVWSKYRTVYFDEFLASADGRHEYWRQKCEMHREFADAQPNAGHHVLARWEAAGRIHGVITQNIDGLHQMAGSSHVLELHGTARQAACLDCTARYEIGPLVEQFLAQNRAPDCPACGGRLKHATISFGQMLPADVLMEATRWAREADLILAIGSSLVVTPAADLPRIAKAHGARLVIINRDPTPLDPFADAILSNPIGQVLSAINSASTP